ncbi:MAG: hypothetical protein QGH74_00360 [Candidatus Brocadiia bacterium]|nr:hypothetical protein [Candidatus Brocadiia bacterium]
MKESAKSEAPGGAFVLWAVVALLALLYLLGWMLGLGTALAEGEAPPPLALLVNLVRRVAWPLCVAVVIFAAGASTGSLLLKLIRCEPASPLPRALFATLLGLGVSAYATLALGSKGLLMRPLFWALAGAMLVAGAAQLLHTLRELREDAAAWMRSWGRFEWALAAIGASLALLALLCAGTPVAAYDTLEYHLGAPGEYFGAGRISFLRHNVYACFPAHVEMLNLEGIVLAGGKAGGMATAVLIQAFFGVLAAAGVGCIAARFARRDAGLPAAVFFLCCPLLIVTLLTAHITLARCAYKAAALLAALAWLFGPERERRMWLVLGGLCCGLAVAVKYTAAATLCVPLGALVLGVSLARGRDWRSRLAAPAALAGLALLAVLPWFARSFVATGNPVYPLLYGVFGAQGWSAEQAAKFAQAHAVGSIGEFPLHLWRFLTAHSDKMSPGFVHPLVVIFVPVLIVALLEARRRGGESPAGLHGKALAAIAGYWAVFVLVWALATHGIARFLAPSLIALSVLSAAGFCVACGRGRAGTLLRGLVLAGACWAVLSHASLAYLEGGLGGALAGDDLAELARIKNLAGPTEYAEAVEWVNRESERSTMKIMLVGEARTYYFNAPVVYSVVFNDHPIETALAAAVEGNLKEAVRLLRATGATHVLVNWMELRRLGDSYRYKWKDERRPGYLPGLQWRPGRAGGKKELALETREPLQSLLRAAGKRVAGFGTGWAAIGAEEGEPIIEIYELGP